MKKIIGILSKVMSNLSLLSDEELEQLLNGKARLRYEIIEKKCAKLDKGVKEDFLEVKNKLNSMKSRESALIYLSELNLKKSDILKIASEYEISLPVKDKNGVLIEKLIENVVGSKLRFDSLLDMNLKK